MNPDSSPLEPVVVRRSWVRVAFMIHKLMNALRSSCESERKCLLDAVAEYGLIDDDQRHHIMEYWQHDTDYGQCELWNILSDHLSSEAGVEKLDTVLREMGLE